MHPEVDGPLEVLVADETSRVVLGLVARGRHVFPQSEVGFERGLALAADKRVRPEAQAGDVRHGLLKRLVFDRLRGGGCLLALVSQRLEGYGRLVVGRGVAVPFVVRGGDSSATAAVLSRCRGLCSSSGVVYGSIVSRHQRSILLNQPFKTAVSLQCQKIGV